MIFMKGITGRIRLRVKYDRGGVILIIFKTLEAVCLEDLDEAVNLYIKKQRLTASDIISITAWARADGYRLYTSILHK